MAADRLAFRDAEKTVVLIATGPSAGDADLEIARDWPTVVVNDAWRLAPWAAALYACDRAWWRIHHKAVTATFRGELWTQDAAAARDFGLNRIPGRSGAGLSADPGVILFNGNSGAQAMGLAYHWGARRFVLVGYDCGPREKQTHFFGNHPKGLRNDSPYALFQKNFGVIAADCARLGVAVVNTSSISRLRCFPRASLSDALRRA